MRSWPEFVYNRSPIWFQNALITAYGFKLHRMRYGRKFWRYLRELEASQWLSKDELAHLQLRKLSQLLVHAYRNTPYYGDLFDSNHIRPGDIRTLEDLGKIPTLSKRIIRENPERLVARDISARRLVPAQTSGTTGTALRLYQTGDVLARMWAAFERARHWAGVRVGQRRATFIGRLTVPYRQKKPPFWRYNAIEKQLLFSVYHMSPQNLGHYNEALKRFQPVYIDNSYPSAVYTLAEFIRRNHLRTIRLKAAITTAETLLDGQRSSIEEVFGCPVYDEYGCSEFAVFVRQCSQGGYHINSELCIVEVLDEAGDLCRTGQIGRVVVTSLINYAQPLIRYEIGDRGAMADGECPCGRKLPLMKAIVGRVEDVVVTPEKRLIGRFDPIFKELRSIREAQIIQTAPAALIVKVVKGLEYTNGDTEKLLDALYKRVGTGMHIDIEFVDRIPRTRAGKFRAVISNLSPRDEQLIGV